MINTSIQVKTKLMSEKHQLLVPASCYRDKAYQLIDCEAKQRAGAADVLCSTGGF